MVVIMEHSFVRMVSALSSIWFATVTTTVRITRMNSTAPVSIAVVMKV